MNYNWKYFLSTYDVNPPKIIKKRQLVAEATISGSLIPSTLSRGDVINLEGDGWFEVQKIAVYVSKREVYLCVRPALPFSVKEDFGGYISSRSNKI